jgi:Raf kinase inhibitor-like YbhB/YbcL family protein
VTGVLGRLLFPLRAGAHRSRLVGREYDAPTTLRITSSAFPDGGTMPTACASRGVGTNTSPPLEWRDTPADTKDLVLILEDVDVPLPRPLIHTVAVIAPHLNALDEGELHAGTPGLRFVPTAFRHRGYLGPGPIPGHGPHRYLFHVFALDIAVPNTVHSTKAVLGTLPGHVLARGVLTGTYER